ncbi:hypothetical protein [Pseudoalteromonas phenolica]|uniref:hypothetical protein n=1 Tax=Pseudoalteromonas phenolica TaxID=161398 RepID=UPI00384A9F4C
MNKLREKDLASGCDSVAKQNIVEKQEEAVTRDYHPTNGVITIKAVNQEEAFEKVLAALNAHPDIDCDWIDGVATDS